jgi:O-antigen/teichoic acid export membrane protein
MLLEEGNETAEGAPKLLGRRGAGQFGLAVFDQGVTSFGSLALQVALAMLLVPVEFGSFAVAASLQGIAYLIIYAVLLEPMAVVGAQRSTADAHLYLVRTLAALAVASLCAAAALGLAALIAAAFNTSVAYALTGAMLGLPGIILGWFARRAAYLQSRIALALVGSGTAAALMLAGMVLLYLTDRLSAGTGLALSGLASGAGGLLCLGAMNIGAAETGRAVVDGSWRAILREHRPLARWGLLNALSAYASRDLYAPLLAVIGGLEIAAVHRAAMIVGLPIAKLCGITSMFLQPQISRAVLRWTPADIKHVLYWIFGGVLVLAPVGGLLLWPILPPLVELVFPDPIYTASIYYFYVAVMASLVFFLIDASVNVVLRALRRFDLIFWPAFVSGLVAAIFGVLGVWLAGLQGAAAALAASALVLIPAAMIACASLFRPLRHGGRTPGPEVA